MGVKKTESKIPIYKINSKEKLLNYYANWTDKDQYNQDMIDWNYQAPINSSQLLNKYISNKKIKILDAGCGSGLVGKELKNLGYNDIIGVDFSKEMLKLIPDNIYNKLDLIDLNNPLEYQTNSFDCIICVGTFTFGHVKAHTLDEFVRITNKGGLICFTINEGVFEDYGFNRKIEELSHKRAWKILEFSKSSYIVNKNIKAWLYLARKL